jgi:hypothetical protein
MNAREDDVRRIVTVVYVALLASVGACAAVMMFLPIAASRTAPRPAMEWGLLATGLGEYAAATLVGRRLLSVRRGNALVRARSYFLIRFAAALAMAFFGLAAFSLGASFAHAAAFLAVSVLMFAATFPGRRAFSDAVAGAGGNT